MIVKINGFRVMVHAVREHDELSRGLQKDTELFLGMLMFYLEELADKNEQEGYPLLAKAFREDSGNIAKAIKEAQ